LYNRPTDFTNILVDQAANTTDSPDIGPPPVSNFIDEDPVKIDLPIRYTVAEEDADPDPTLSVNLEQRKKRKDPTIVQVQKRTGRFEQTPSHPGKDLAPSLRAGAKRKLSSQEDEEGPQTTALLQTSPDEFKYTKRATGDSQATKPSTKIRATREIAVARIMPREKSSLGTSVAGRKALQPKSTNTDIANSPKKNIKDKNPKSLPLGKGDNPQKDTVKDRIRGQKSEQVLFMPMAESVPQPIDINPEPETPLAPDLFSPPSSSTSMVAESRDTPPPGDLAPGFEGHRPSRRARGNVSYALPNLRDKMRRPTEELVDAVTGEGKTQRLSINRVEASANSTNGKVKQEVENDDSWKNLPSAATSNVYSKSPLSDKIMPRDHAMEVLVSQKQRRRESLADSKAEAEIVKSGPSSAISALMASSRRTRRETTPLAAAEDNIEKGMARLDIYDFASSPASDTASSKVSEKPEERRAIKSVRRLSSMGEAASSNGIACSDDSGSKNAATVSSRRRQSMMGLGTASSSDTSETVTADSLRESISQNQLSGISNGDSRSERVSARRRSMML
jgi:hypothetical protein